MQKRKNLGDHIKEQMVVEMAASVMISFIGLFLTYYFKGQNGINEAAKSFGKQIQTDSLNLYYLGTSLMLGIVFFILNRYFHTRYNTIFYKISNIYFNIVINIYRLMASFLLGFSMLYFIYEYKHLSSQVILFLFYGFLSLFITTCLVIFLEYINKRPEREIKIYTGIHSR